MEQVGGDNDTEPCGNSTAHVETNVSEWLWKTIGPVIFLTGITGNILVLWVLKRLRFTSSSTLVHLFVLALADLGVLCSGLLRLWVLYVFDYDVRHISDFGCRFHMYFTYTIMDFSAWILVSVTCERVVCVYFPLHVKAWCTASRACWRLVLTFFVLSVVNCHMFWSYGLSVKDGELSCQLLDKRMYIYDRYIFVWVDLCFVSLLPFAIMIVCNIFIIRTLRRQYFYTHWNGSTLTKQNAVYSSRNKKHTTTIRLLLVVTSFFACSTMPASLVYIVEAFVKRECAWKTNAQVQLAWTVTYLLQFTNYAANFLLYTARSRKFRTKVLVLFHLKNSSLHTTSFRTISSSASLQSCSDNPDSVHGKRATERRRQRKKTSADKHSHEDFSSSDSAVANDLAQCRRYTLNKDIATASATIDGNGDEPIQDARTDTDTSIYF